MSSLTVSDLSSKFQSSPFLDIVQGEFLKVLNFFGSGFLAEAPDEVRNSGLFGNMPKWNVDLTAATEISTSSTLTPGENSAYNDAFIWQELEYGWSAQQLIKTVAGRSYDSLEEIARHIGQYWGYQIQARAIAVLKGIFATALASSHSTGATYSGAIITQAGVLAAKFKLGDYAKFLSLMIMNSKVEQDAINASLITFPAGAVGSETFRSGNIGQIFGMQPYADDDITAVSSVYSSYLGGPRSAVFKLRPREKSSLSGGLFARTSGNIDLEMVRSAYSAGGTDDLISRISVMIHVPGVSWNTATSTFTTSDLSTGSNWSKVAANKEIKIAELKTL